MLFTKETKQWNKIPFLDAMLFVGKFTTRVYRKPTFSSVYIHFHSFLPSTYKTDIIYTILYRCCRCRNNWSVFHSQLKYLKEIFQKIIFLNCTNLSFKTPFLECFLDSHFFAPHYLLEWVFVTFIAVIRGLLRSAFRYFV